MWLATGLLELSLRAVSERSSAIPISESPLAFLSPLCSEELLEDSLKVPVELSLEEPFV